jgi:DNA-binding NarL/FixJ family response regulator
MPIHGSRIIKKQSRMCTDMNRTVLLVDGYKFTRYCLRKLIEADNATLLLEAADMSEARCAIAVQAIDLVLIDISDPSKNGLETFCDLKASLPGVPVMVVNGEDGDMQVAHYLRLGCKGYLTKHARADVLRNSIEQVLAGDFPAIYQQNAPVSMRIAGQTTPGYETLSFRELQIFLKLLKGKSTTLIAKELQITASSVSIFKSKLLQKLALSSHADLIAYALRSHLVRLPDSMQTDSTVH